MLMFTCTDYIFFILLYIIWLFWSKTGNDTAILPIYINGYIFLKVIPQGNLIIKDVEFLV
jgi:hypothetical protein